jgi:hypothetical protein
MKFRSFDLQLLDNLPSLTHLRLLSVNGLTLTERSLVNLRNLEQFDTSFSGLDRLPENVFVNMSRLRVLSLRGSSFLFETLNENKLNGLNNLRELNLQDMKWNEFNLNLLSKVPKLKYLYLSGYYDRKKFDLLFNELQNLGIVLDTKFDDEDEDEE